jgi:hypothetical protein
MAYFLTCLELLYPNFSLFINMEITGFRAYSKIVCNLSQLDYRSKILLSKKGIFLVPSGHEYFGGTIQSPTFFFGGTGVLRQIRHEGKFGTLKKCTARFRAPVTLPYPFPLSPESSTSIANPLS